MPERLRRGLRIFHELAAIVAAGPYAVDDILQRISSEFRSAFALERALLVRYDVERKTLHAFVQQGVDWPGDDWLPIERFPFLEHALDTREAVLVRDARGEGAAPSAIIKRFGITSVVAVPLSIEDRCLGFLAGDRGGREFTLNEDDLQVLTALGVVAAVFIDKADQYADLQRALEELRDLDQAKSDFISVASHELRTPIAVVHGIAATLHRRGADLSAQQLVALWSALYEQTMRLGVLTEQLLDLSRLDAGAFPLRRERFRARERCENLVRHIAPDRADEISVAIDPRLELETDPLAFERVLSNLLENALHYGRHPVELRAEPDGAHARVVVEDRGDGVEPEFVPQLFDRFSRSDRMRDRRTGGAGLGLAIASSFANAVGGTLTYEPAQPEGARFTFLLPVSGVPENARMASRATSRHVSR